MGAEFADAFGDSAGVSEVMFPAAVPVMYYLEAIVWVDAASLAVAAMEKVGLPIDREGWACLPIMVACGIYLSFDGWASLTSVDVTDSNSGIGDAFVSWVDSDVAAGRLGVWAVVLMSGFVECDGACSVMR